MAIIVWVILIFSVLQFVIALVNLLFQPKYTIYKNIENSLVSVLIPARNEEKNIGKLLSDLQQQSFKNIEVIVFNDQSNDKTEDIVNQFVKKDKRFVLINSTELPDGWLGKNHACYTLGNRAKGSCFLFLDADVRIGKNLIAQIVSYHKIHRLSLLSFFPIQQMKTLGEQTTVPNMNFILLTILPLVLVEKTKFTSLSAANGQLMLFNANTYKQIQPHKKLRMSKVEDIEISRLFKKNGLSVACHTGSTEIFCRMYSSFHEAVNGFSKNVIMFFGNSTLLAILFWLITTFGFVFILLEKQLPVFIVFIIIIISTRVMVAIKSKQNIVNNILLFPVQQITLGIFILKSIINRYRKNYEWKGRRVL